jgi:nitrate reductase NapD
MAETRLPVISSAIVAVVPGRRDSVIAALARFPHTEIWAAEQNKIVITLEAQSRGEAGQRLTEMALLDGVAAANMVFECIERDEGVRS